MRVLFATGSAAGYMRPPIMGDEQIVCGPDWTDERSSDGRVRSLKTPVGEYDLATIAEKLPGSQKPDVVVCLVDAAWRNLPRNLAAFACPKVLLIADTHHLTAPLMSMLRYMASEPYDRSVFLYDRHHASFFHAAGFRNLYWFPGLTFPHSDEKVRKARAQGVRQPQIAFVGQVGFLHPLRSRMYTTLIEKKLPVVQKKLSQDESLGFYGSSLLAFNASLNGDLNLRVFETLSTGAALLTDRLAPESGLERLLVDGREMLTYGSADELIEKATHALANPRETQAIGNAGSDWFDIRFNDARRRKAFQELAFDGKAVPEFEFSPEEKTRVYFGGDTDRLLQAIMVYEGVQEMHRVEPAVKIALDANVPEDVAEMYATLPRLTTLRVEKETTETFDVSVFGKKPTVVPSARCLWCWDAQEEDMVALAPRLEQAGYGLPSRDVAMFCQVQQSMPDSYASASYWHNFGVWHRKHGRLIDALAALLQAVALSPEGIDSQMELGITALAYGHGMIAREAFTEVLRFRPNDKEATRGLAKAKRREEACDYERPRDLLISHVEVTRLQGTGVLIQRFFPDSDDFITVRSRSLYGNKVDFGGTHYAIDLPRISDEARAGILRRLLKPYRIRRIIAVPFYPTDFVHALVAKEITGAPLCTYVMDDQILYSKEVPEELAQKLFAATDLRLAISPEMAKEYSSWFGCSFGLLPPIVTNRENEVPNAWDAAKVPANCGAVVGNIWSAQQFEQMRAFLRSAGMTVHWFGNADVPWLPQDKKELEREGILACGFLPEEQLAKRLSAYPYVVIPSGMLDGTEDNEWLTRLSLPSRMVFILTKTQTPMLILGSADTAAARFVNQFGLGVTSNYDPAEAPAKLRELTSVESRARILASARRTAGSFIVPGCGEWIWNSLAVSSPLPTPFGSLYSTKLADVMPIPSADKGTDCLVNISRGEAGKAKVTDHSQSEKSAVTRPKTLNLQAIDLCNSRCIMCNIWKDGKRETVTLEELRTLLSNSLYSEVQHVGITGGEPTLRKDLLDLYRLLPECLPGLTGASFITHGMQTERTVEVYAQVFEHYRQRKLTFEGMVSLDGIGAVHDKVRGRSGAFEAATRTLLALKERGVPVIAACTIVKSNVFELHDLLEWGKEHGVYVRFRVAEFIRRLYNDSCDGEIRRFNSCESRHLVSFFHVLLTEYEKDETIKKTYKSILSLLTGGHRLIACPYQKGLAINVDSRGHLEACAPKGASVEMTLDLLALNTILTTQRAELQQTHCANCIHDYHDDWSASTQENINKARLRNHDLYELTEEQLTTTEMPVEPLDLLQMKQILLVGWYGTETAGDIAILQGIITEYLAKNPSLRFQVLSLYPYYTLTTIADWPEDLRSRVSVFDYVSEEAWQATIDCDAVVMAGGPLMDIPETRKILCLFRRFAELGKPRVIEGCGVGPLNQPVIRWNVCRIARLATRISLRDRASREMLRSFLIRKPIEVRMDPAVTFLRAQKIQYHGAGSKIIRCFFRELTTEYPQELTPTQAAASLVSLLRSLLKWYPEYRIELWAMHHFPVGKDDRLFARQLVREIADSRLSVEWLPRSPREIMAAMAAAEFCVCMRFHSCVFASEAGVPFLAIDYTAGGKIQGFLEDIDQDHRLCRLGALGELDREQFESKLQARAAENVRAANASPSVLHIVPSVTGGGAARAAIWLAKHSRRLGGPVHRMVSLSAADATGLEIARQNGVEILDQPEWKELRAEMAVSDIVMVHWWNCPELTTLFHRELPAMRLVLWLHVGGYHAPQVLTKPLVEFADLAVACSPHTYAHPVFAGLSEDVRRERTAMVLAGADFDRLTGICPRAHVGFNIGYLGTVDSVKMHADFIEMSSAANVPEAKFIVCGKEDPSWLSRRAEQLNVRDRFDFRGSVEDIKGLLETLDVYGYPLCPETYAAAELNLQEVMFAGVPVVAFPYGGISRLIQHGETGLLVNTSEEYAKAIERLCHDPAERTRLGNNAATYARNHWGAERAASEFNEHFKRLLEKSKTERSWESSSIELAGSSTPLAIHPGARMFLESLGETAHLFMQSIQVERWEESLRADEQIAAATHLMRYNGIIPYRNAYPQDPFLQLWTGLGDMRGGNHPEALNSFVRSANFGFTHWKIDWYKAQGAELLGLNQDASASVDAVLRAAPYFTPAQLMRGRLPSEDSVASCLRRVKEFLRANQPIRARDLLAHAITLAPHDLNLMELLCEMECRLNNLESARRYYDLIIRRDTKRHTPRLHAIRAALSITV